MPTKTGAGVSLASLDARTASETPFRFEYILPNGEGSGVFLHVLGPQSPKVTAEVNRLLNERRRKEAMREAQRRVNNRRGEDFDPVEDDIVFGHRLAAVRLVGWEGITEPYTVELALQLITSNQHIADQVAEQSGALENFMKTSLAS